MLPANPPTQHGENNTPLDFYGWGVKKIPVFPAAEMSQNRKQKLHESACLCKRAVHCIQCQIYLYHLAVEELLRSLENM